MALDIFLQYFIVIFLEIHLLFIFVSIAYITIKRRRTILNNVRRNIPCFLLIMSLVLFSAFIRINTISQTGIFNNSESLFSAVEGLDVVLNDKFNFVCDAPVYPMIISIFYRIFGIRADALSAINAFFSILIIPLSFIFVQMLFKKRSISTLAVIITSSFPYFNGAAVSEYPFMISTFFVMLSFVFLLSAMRQRSAYIFFLSGITFAFSFQIYYYEIIFVLCAVIYLMLVKGIKILFKPHFWIFLIAFILSISPFLIQQKISKNECPHFKRDINLPDNLMCKISRNFCKMFNLNNVINGDDTRRFYLNDIRGNLASYVTYLFGYGRTNKFLYVDSWEFKQVKDSMFNKLYILHIFFIIFAVVGIMDATSVAKNTILLFMIFCGSILFWSLWREIVYVFWVPFETIAFIPLISFGAYSFVNLLKLKKSVKTAILVIVLIIFISNFFHDQNAYTVLKQQIDPLESKTKLLNGEYLCSNLHLPMPKPLKESCNIFIDKLKFN